MSGTSIKRRLSGDEKLRRILLRPTDEKVSSRQRFGVIIVFGVLGTTKVNKGVVGSKKNIYLCDQKLDQGAVLLI